MNINKAVTAADVHRRVQIKYIHRAAINTTLQTYLLMYVHVATCRVSGVARFIASQGAMRAFLMHSHGKLRFSNKHVDLDTLRPARPEGARLLVLPNIQIQGSTRLERVTSLRDQIHQVNVEMHLHVRRL